MQPVAAHGLCLCLYAGHTGRLRKQLWAGLAGQWHRNYGDGGTLYPPSSGLVPLYPPSQRCGLCQNFKQTTLTTRLYEVRTNLYSPLMKKFRRACGRHTLVGPRNHILDAVGHRRHLVNITERSVCCGNAALCQITLTTGFLFLCHFLQALS